MNSNGVYLMSHAKTLLSAAVLALHANFAAAQEQLLPQDISIDDTLHTREPVYVVLPTSNGELVRDFTACTSDNHLVTGNFALRADIDYANAQIENGGLEALSRQASVDGFMYQRALTEVIGSMTLANVKRSQITSSASQAQLRDNVATVHDYFRQDQSSPIQYNFHIDENLLRRPRLGSCPQA